MKTLLLLILILSSFAVSAEIAFKKKIAVVTSFKTTDGKNIFNFYNYDSNKKVESVFRKRFDPLNYDLQVIHHASLTDVWNVMHDNSVDALFFIGHGTESIDGALGAKSLILNENLINLKDAFSNVSPNLKYLAVISCYSEKVLKAFSEKGFYKNAPQLRVKSFPAEVDLMKGIASSVDEFFGIQNMDTINSEENANDDDSLELEITRNHSEDSNAPAIVVYNEKAVGFFDGTSDSKTIVIKLPKKEVLGSAKKISIDTGHIVLDKKIDIGELTLNSDGGYNCQLDAERNRKGEILGVSKNYYKLKCD
jgi:hypothetical protein